jgi:hypothetical protein
LAVCLENSQVLYGTNWAIRSLLYKGTVLFIKQLLSMNRDSDNSNLILVGRNQFLLLFVSLSAVFSIAVGIIMWDDIVTYVIRFHFKSEVESKFGFNGDELVVADDFGNKQKYFVITKIESGGNFEKAGVRKDDVLFPEFWSCRSGNIVRSDEGILFSKLHFAKDGEIFPLYVINLEELNKFRFDYDKIRKLFLKVQK